MWMITSQPTVCANRSRCHVNHRLVTFGSPDAGLVHAWAQRFNARVVTDSGWSIAIVEKEA